MEIAEQIESTVAELTDPKRLILIEATDHFFTGGLEQLETAVANLDAGQA